MILITAVIKETEPGGAILVKFNGQDIEGSTEVEGDIADALREAMVDTRNKIFAKEGWTREEIRHHYTRQFESEEERDKHI